MIIKFNDSILLSVLQELFKNECESVLIGGCVRDKIIGIITGVEVHPKDISYGSGRLFAC